jgi:hypothetical protein
MKVRMTGYLAQRWGYDLSPQASHLVVRPYNDNYAILRDGSKCRTARARRPLHSLHLTFEGPSRRPAAGHNRTVSIAAQLAAKQPYRVDTREQRVDRTSGAAAET